jgi:hypothetical protein
MQLLKFDKKNTTISELDLEDFQKLKRERELKNISWCQGSERFENTHE